MWTAFAGILALIVWGTISANNEGNNNGTGDGEIIDIEVNEGDWVKGNPDSEIVIIEYSDFQCPACGYYYQIAKDIVSEFGSHIKFVYRHFPLTQIHDNAMLASQAAEAAGVQGKFFEMHDLLFENQSTWSNLSADEAQEIFVEYAQQLELDSEKFIAALNNDDIIDKIEDSYSDGIKAGINSTPTFILNGKQISPSDFDDFREIIRETLDAETT